MLFGIWWITNRREDVKEYEQKNNTNHPTNGKS
jgi:hypothetical protein